MSCRCCSAATSAKKRRRAEKKVEFEPAVVAAAGELAHERELRALDKDLDRKRLELEKAKRDLVGRHPCAEQSSQRTPFSY